MEKTKETSIFLKEIAPLGKKKNGEKKLHLIIQFFFLENLIINVHKTSKTSIPANSLKYTLNSRINYIYLSDMFFYGN